MKKVLHASILSFNKKRKLQAEQLGLPRPKHKCWDRSFASEDCWQSNSSKEVDGLFTFSGKVKVDGGMRDDESDLGSAKDTNSFSGDGDSFMSVTNGSKPELNNCKGCLCDERCSCSVYWRSNCYSLDSSSTTKASEQDKKSPDNVEVQSSFHSGIGLFTSMDYEEHLLGVVDHADYNCSEYEENWEQNAEECEDIHFSSEVNPNNYVLSSGRWNVNEGTETAGSSNLTIDKEFEQYFSMLMLK